MAEGKPLRADARRNRDALLATGRELFAAGDESIRFDDFAAHAGVGVGTLYRHFPTREELAAAVYEEEVATLCALAHELRETLPAGEALAAMLRQMVDHIDAGRTLVRRIAALLAAAPATMARDGLRLEGAVAELFADGVRAGVVRDDVPVGAVMMALHGIGASQERPDWRAEADGVIALVVDGIRPKPRAANRQPAKSRP
ncbi:MAG: TetR family transcriptional regulator [Leifsonia xyli]|nr:MAG: TetR family transcriptional regulator [Leifsonia xyli]